MLKRIGLLALALPLVLVLAVACGDDDDDDDGGDTTPTSVVTEEPTDEATEEPTDEATEEPTDEATEEPTDEATEEPAAGATLELAAADIAYDTDTLEASAGPITIEFDNQDSGIPHNVAVYGDEEFTEEIFTGEIITGPDQITYEVGELEAGEYYFHCDVHPAMEGTLTVS